MKDNVYQIVPRKQNVYQIISLQYTKTKYETFWGIQNVLNDITIISILVSSKCIL